MSGIDLITAERKRQIDREGYDAAHDSNHDCDEIALAAATYALPECQRREVRRTYFGDYVKIPDTWPWKPGDWKPTPDDRVRELVKAGALIAAEIDRLIDLAPIEASSPRPPRLRGEGMNRLPPSSMLLLRLVRTPQTLSEIMNSFQCSPRARANRERLTRARLVDLFFAGLVSLERRPNGRFALTAAGREAIDADDARKAKSRYVPEAVR